MDLDFVFRFEAELVVFVDDLDMVWEIVPANLS